MKKTLLIFAILFSFIISLSQPTGAAENDAVFCEQYKGVKKIWWDGIELKSGQIGRLVIVKDTPLFKLNGEKRVIERTLKAGEFYRIYAFKPGILSVGGGFFVERDTKVKYETPSKTKLNAVKCISKGKVSNEVNTENDDCQNKSIVLTPRYTDKTTVISADDEEQLKAYYLDKPKQGQLPAVIEIDTPYNVDVQFASENPKIAQITKDGLLKGISEGKTNIVITSNDGKCRRKAPVIVKPLFEVQKNSTSSTINITGYNGSFKRMEIVASKDNKTVKYLWTPSYLGECRPDPWLPFNKPKCNSENKAWVSNFFGLERKYSKKIDLSLGEGHYKIDIYNVDTETRVPKQVFSTTTQTSEKVYLLPNGKDIPSENKEIVNLAKDITKGITDDYQKVKAIHDWVSQNISYDYERFQNKTAAPYQSALTVLNTRIAVCEGYSNLTASLLRSLGIKTKVVAGLGAFRSPGYEQFEDSPGINIHDSAFDDSRHAWNEAYVNNRWVNMDTTWSSGNGYKIYFDMTESEFRKDHIKFYTY
ncbi:hypothetical protein BK139_06900 [Paenibacillus sp. FSL R5-0490]|uniref:transglutaminase domain-containing protein n=1 Tax=Paenibacillus sp. FSL R5-0490 TaxID=1920424 RepID=UPI00096C8E31|nr:transglutaminase domain-containing protein [Paenibacillus sp. FSL R5-0490]OMF61560.1 hypothetical protein BK139_06900 [Paenibacillus sp. FSL R5-0490]